MRMGSLAVVAVLAVAYVGATQGTPADVQVQHDAASKQFAEKG